MAFRELANSNKIKKAQKGKLIFNLMLLTGIDDGTSIRASVVSVQACIDVPVGTWTSWRMMEKTSVIIY